LPPLVSQTQEPATQPTNLIGKIQSPLLTSIKLNGQCLSRRRASSRESVILLARGLLALSYDPSVARALVLFLGSSCRRKCLLLKVIVRLSTGQAVAHTHVELMKPRFFITIDTEEDDWGEYRSSGFSLKAIQELHRVQDIFNAYGAVPTYLITYPVVNDPASNAFFLEQLANQRCEIGAHCHPWNTPPFCEELNERNSMLCNLPYATVKAKIATLKEAISKSFNIVPLCFRAGRWGFGPEVAAAIYELGFRVDTSVCPYVDWSLVNGPDYRAAPTCTYRFRPNEILSAVPNGPLLEVPATIGFLQRDERFCRRATAARGLARWLHIRGLLDKARIVNLRWLSPELSSARDMVALAKRTLWRGCTHLNLSFHSTTLVPGRTPFVRTARDLDIFLRSVEAVIKYAAAEGLVFGGLSHLLQDA